MISSQAVGKELPPSVEEVSTRRLLAYAAGIGDHSAGVFDDLGALAGVPAFCTSLEWPVLSHPAHRELLGAEPAELLRGVHVTQDSRFHRPVRPGMRLVTRGTLTGMRGTRAGVLATLRADTTDDDGPVVTSWIQTLYRGVDLVGTARESEAPPAAPEPDAPGEPERVEIPIAPELPHVYTECARIWNPIHTERRVARAAGLPDLILHGTASWALAGREIVARVADGDPARLQRLRGRFRAMVLPGSAVELLLWRAPGARGGCDVSFSLRNADGEEAIAGGFAAVAAGT